MPVFAGFTFLKCRNMALAFLIYMFFAFICKLFMHAKVYKIFRFCKTVLFYLNGKTGVKGEMLLSLLFIGTWRYLTGHVSGCMYYIACVIRNDGWHRDKYRFY